MLFPVLDNDIGIIINNGFNLLHVSRFDVVALSKNKSTAVSVEFGHTIFAFDMNVYRFVLFTIKEERETIKPKNFGHNYSALSFNSANFGIIFDTTKFFLFFYRVRRRVAPSWRPWPRCRKWCWMETK